MEPAINSLVDNSVCHGKVVSVETLCVEEFEYAEPIKSYTDMNMSFVTVDQ